LYWSHFQAALEWDDAEMWLEGALQNDWSVSQMREQRAATLGQAAARADALAAQVDALAATEETVAEESLGDERITPSAARLSAADLADRVEEDDDADETPFDGTSDEASDDEPAPRRSPPVQPFAELPELPDDLQAAFDTFKLAILNHRRAGWSEVSCGDVVATLDALKALAMAPLET
jgi:hypothetical protein